MSDTVLQMNIRYIPTIYQLMEISFIGVIAKVRLAHEHITQVLHLKIY